MKLSLPSDKLPIIVASAVWGQKWIGRHIPFQCYNAEVVAVIIVNCSESRHPLGMHYTHMLFLLGASTLNFTFHSKHIRGGGGGGGGV